MCVVLLMDAQETPFRLADYLADICISEVPKITGLANNM